MKKINYSALILVLTLFSCNYNSENKSNATKTIDSVTKNESDLTVNIGGTYSFGENIDRERVGTLLVYPNKAQSALFFLDINNGAPSYNAGQLFGVMKIKENIGLYESKDRKCRLKFKFQGREIKILSDRTDEFCGFGNGVIAENTYTLRNKSNPKYFIWGPDTIYFQGLTEEKYNQFLN
jgi:hypothetical protein